MRPFFFLLLLHSFKSPETAQLLYLLERNTHGTNMGRNLVCPQFEGNVLPHMLPKTSRMKKNVLLHQIIDRTQTQNSDGSESCDPDMQTQSHSCGCARPRHGNRGSSTVALLRFCAYSSEELFFFF